ncbi:MAG: hypothetical protein ACOCXX_03675, partial [Planctomycetota bacterium]
IQAEGAAISVWQNFILPSMTVFQAKNAYGRGCPWSCNDAGAEVQYNPEDYPEATRHTETHFGMTEPLRAPNGPNVGRLVGQAIAKVMSHLDEVDPDKILDD